MCAAQFLKSDLVIFHYHLFPGGVTNVVTLSIRAILEHLPQIRRIRLVCGSERHLQGIRHHLSNFTPDAEKRVEIEVLPELFYLRRDARPGDADVPDVVAVKQLLLSHFGGGYWWVHNFHLGKNPVFTQALLEIAAEHPEQTLLFHIHDFPECARYDNLTLLGRFVNRPLYPTSENVRYAVINRRDLRLLISAGVPTERVVLLDNPVPGDRPAEPDRRGVRERLERAFADRFSGYRPEAPLLFYPVRTIRRKNALEAGLFTRLSEEPANLIITLPGVSEKEAPYSSLVHQCYVRGLIPGMSGIGTELAEAGIGFQELALSTDCVVSSSVQEGFGYLFIDGRRWRKAVFARYLDILDGITEIVDGDGAHFYRELQVPIDRTQRAKLLQAYRSRATEIAPSLPEWARENLLQEIEDAFAGTSVDFSYLGVPDQLTTLEESDRDEGLRAEIVALNRELFDALTRLIHTHPDDIDERIQSHFSLESFAASLADLLDGFPGPIPPESDPPPAGSPPATVSTPPAGTRDPIHERLLAGFATLEYIRLLYSF
ncbi:MAG TPA: hypothetical protein VMW69_14565 [Spirochaetia bacterium]|nr:hypothetical protein [Spirochaetia bacterium]